MTRIHFTAAIRGRGIGRRVLLAGLAAATLTACRELIDPLLEVEAPSRVLPASLSSPAQAPLLVNSAIGDFECAFANYVYIAGLVADEFEDSQLGSAQTDFDRRTITNGGTYQTYAIDGCLGWGVYIPISTARWLNDDVLQRLEGWTDAEVPNRTLLMATVAAYSGYSHILLGEGFCQAAIDLSPALQPAEIFARAEAKFTQAINLASTLTGAEAASILNMARVGRARTRLNLGNPSGAAADATLVPEGFVRNATYSGASTRRENKVYNRNERNAQITVDPLFRNVTYDGVPDPRVPVVNTGRRGGDQSKELWAQRKYTSVSSPIPIASWEEAQLILAEVAGGATAVGIVNNLHARAGIPPLTPTDEANIAAQVIEERRRELFLESHRLYDLIRYGLPFRPLPGTPNSNGGTYGTMTCFPLPDIEIRNNPNIPSP